MRYKAHHILTDPARPTSSLFRLLGGVVMILVTVLLLQAFAGAAINEIQPQNPRTHDDLIHGTSATGVLLILYSFLVAYGALWLSLHLIHERALHTLFGPFRLVWHQFKYACWPLMVLLLLLLILPSPDGMAPERHLETRTWLLFLLPGLLGVLIQTSAEEALFRGYLQSQLAARFQSPLIWLGLPSILFGLVHYDPQLNGAQAWLVVGWATVFGLAAADLTARAGSLGPAIAFHFVNNASAILIAAPKGWLDGLALYTYPFSLDDPQAVWTWAPVDMLWIFCAWLAIRLTLQR